MVTEEQLEEINDRISWVEFGSWETSLDLSGLSIDSETLERVMPEILKIENLTELNLSNNNLTSLPRSISELSNLTRLIATDNKIQDLSDILDNLGNLESLDFSGNLLSPDSARHLSHIIQTIEDVTEDYEYALSILYPDDDERSEIAKQIEASDLDPAAITSETVFNDNIIQNTVSKSSKNAIKLFLSKAPVHNAYDLNVYGPTVKMLLSQLRDPNIPIEDRNTIQLGITSSLGNCDTPVKEHLMRVKIAELLKSGEKLSEENYLMIERLALIEATGKLKNLPPNEKIEAVNALVSLVYSRKHIVHVAKESDIHLRFINGENENLTKQRDLPPISINSEYGFTILSPDIIEEFVDLVSARNIGIVHELNEKKLKELTDNYLFSMGLQNDSIAVEREKYIQIYPEDMQKFMENPDISETLFSADMTENENDELMNFPAHQEVLRDLLKNENKEESIKQKYEEFVSEQQSKIQDFVDRMQTPQTLQAERQGLSTESTFLQTMTNIYRQQEALDAQMAQMAQRVQAAGQGESTENATGNRYHQMASAQNQPHTGESRPIAGSARFRPQAEARGEESTPLPGSARRRP
jgi:Leucine-rich repeat (LRR) protein